MLVDLQRIIIDTFLAAWNSETPVALPNVDFNIDTQAPNGEFVRLSILAGQSQIADLGGSQWRERMMGVIDFGIFTQANGGIGRPYELADIIKNIFERKAFAGNALQCYAASIQELGAGQGMFFQTNLSVPFMYQVNRT